MTVGMKVAVSIPDDVFEEADRLAQELGESRSALYAQALTAFVQTHAPDRVTEVLDAVIDAVAPEQDGFVSAASERLLRKVDW
jgi:metal-responsive CopG/Arc/MetJ family transcriptional regulator